MVNSDDLSKLEIHIKTKQLEEDDHYNTLAASAFEVALEAYRRPGGQWKRWLTNIKEWTEHTIKTYRMTTSVTWYESFKLMINDSDKAEVYISGYM